MREIGELLRKERKSLGLTKKEVAEQMGFKNYQVLSNLESGTRDLKAYELYKLSKIYKKDVDFFLKPRAKKAERPLIRWRNKVDEQVAKKNEHIFLKFCQNYQKLLELTGEIDYYSIWSNIKPEPDKSVFYKKQYSYVEDLARYISKNLNLGSRPACSLPMIIENALGVKILFIDLRAGGSGASTVSEEFGQAILINAHDAPWRRNYDIAHEFFHLITWTLFSEEEIQENQSGVKSQVEKWADAFASAILLPEDEIKEELNRRTEDNSISYLTIVEMAREFLVSVEALLWRLVNLNLVRRDQVEEALDSGEIVDIDRKERCVNWEDQKPYLSYRYISLAIKAFEMEKISKERFAEYIDRPISDIPVFLIQHGYGENEDYKREFTTS
jgi:Zn-dependent peptidase ImmA (M78 family)